MADGSVINNSGSLNLSMVCKLSSINLYVLAPLHKFSPVYAFAQDTYNDYLKP